MKQFCCFVILMVLTQAACTRGDLDQKLLNAISNGDTQGVKLMLSLGADPNAKMHEDAYSALMVAAGNGEFEMVKLLVAAGADVNYEDNSLHSSPIEQAACSGNVHVIKYLLEQGATMEGDRASECLAFAAGANSLEGVKELLDSGCPVSYWSLHSAIKFNNVEMARLLLENGASVNNVFPVNGLTPLMYAVLMNRETETLDMVKLLLQSGADNSITSQNLSFSGMTASEIANQLGFAEIENEILQGSTAATQTPEGEASN